MTRKVKLMEGGVGCLWGRVGYVCEDEYEEQYDWWFRVEVEVRLDMLCLIAVHLLYSSYSS